MKERFVKVIETDRKCVTHAFFNALMFPEKIEKAARTNPITKAIIQSGIRAFCAYSRIQLVEKN